MNIRVESHTLDSLRAQWERFLPGASGRWVFNTPAWLSAWWAGAHTSEEQLVLAACDAGSLCGVAPLMRCGTIIRFLGSSDVCDHHDLLAAPGREQAVCVAVLEALNAYAWDSLELDGLPAQSKTLSILPALAEARGWRVVRADDGVSPALDLPASWDAYIEALPKRDRHELRRKLRRLNEAGVVRYRDVSAAPDLERELERFITLMRLSREDKAQFMTSERERFFRLLASAMQAEGYLRLSFLDLDGLPVAASLAFDFDGAYHLYNSGFDTRYANLSVGLVQKAYSVKAAIEQGRSRYLFLRGPESYKYDLGAQDMHLYKLVIHR